VFDHLVSFDLMAQDNPSPQTLRDFEMSDDTLISIIDDDALARDGIQQLVESLGYRTVTFGSAEHFLGSRVIAETACLITDLQMPGLSGLELQEALRSQGYRTPVILITAYPNESHRNRALDGGAVGFLSKPFDEGSLIKYLTAAIRSRSSNGQASVASTTSIHDSGLFGYLLPTFKQKTGITMTVLSQGTGQALDAARCGDADVVFVHAKPEEEKFLAESQGVKRFPVMYNDFVLIGPKDDPAGIKGMKDVARAFLIIKQKPASFISRGDHSGTHIAELNFWNDAGVHIERDYGPWYKSIGQGMGAALDFASASNSYVLSDRGTWIHFKNKGDLQILVEDDKRMFNQYGVMLVNPAKHPAVKKELGQEFIDWLISPDGQKTIANYKINGEQLFYPNANDPNA
jgi:tungstate transport system substrate-binding protein